MAFTSCALETFMDFRYAETSACAKASKMVSLGSPFSSRTSLKASTNSFFMPELLQNLLFYYKQKSGDNPLFDGNNKACTYLEILSCFKISRKLIQKH